MTATGLAPKPQLSDEALAAVVKVSPIVRSLGESITVHAVDDQPQQILTEYGTQFDEATAEAFSGILASTVTIQGARREAAISRVQTKGLTMLSKLAMQRGEMESLHSLSWSLSQVDSRKAARMARRFDKIVSSRTTLAS